MTFTVASFFAGIGGFDLAFEAAGFDIVLQVEIDDFCQSVLAKHWPSVPKITDIRSANKANVPYADVFCGGFPCQDISNAGHGAGIQPGTRSGLWYDLARIIGEVRPRVVLLENVATIVAAGRGGTEVTGSLTEMGYDAKWGIIRASDVGAPHIRERWFLLAYPKGERLPQWRHESRKDQTSPLVQKAILPNIGFNRCGCPGRWKSRNRIAQSGMGRNVDGISFWLDRHQWPAAKGKFQYPYEPPRQTKGFPYRAERIKALGNAVVPQVVYPLAVMIREWLEIEDMQS